MPTAAPPVSATAKAAALAVASLLDPGSVTALAMASATALTSAPLAPVEATVAVAEAAAAESPDERASATEEALACWRSARAVWVGRVCGEGGGGVSFCERKLRPGRAPALFFFRAA
jgi:hypothetical protein